MLGEVETSESGAKRQFARCKAMSGIGGKADLPVERANFSLWTRSGLCHSWQSISWRLVPLSSVAGFLASLAGWTGI